MKEMNMRRFGTMLLPLPLLLAAGAGLVTSSAGSVTGHVSGSVDLTQAPAVVYLMPADQRSFPPAADEEQAMDQEEMIFRPYILPVQRGTTVNFLNSDTVLHNVFTPSKAGDRFNLGTYPRGEVRSHTFDTPGEVVLLCNVHPEMEAYVYVVDTPYFTTTDGEGSYRISDVAEGAYVVHAWHPDGKTSSREVTLSAAGSITVDLAFE